MSSKCCEPNLNPESNCQPSMVDNNFINKGNLGQPDGECIVTSVHIAQMDCPTEETLIRKRLGGMEQVKDIHFDLIRRILTVNHTIDGLTEILNAIKDLGYTPKVIHDNKKISNLKNSTQQNKTAWVLLTLALTLAIFAEVTHWMGWSAIIQIILSVVAIAISGLSTYKKGLIALKNRNLNINALMSIAVTGAVLIGQWPEAAMVMVLFAIAEAIEAKSLDKARDSVASLMQQAPDQAHVKFDDNNWHWVNVEEVSVDSIISVAPGERIALDGVVIHGASDVNQAPITGESMPVNKQVDSLVYAGSINGMSELHYRVTAKSDETVLARIVYMVHDAQANKAPIQRFVDKFSAIYTPIVCLIAAVIAVVPPLFMGADWYGWIYKALVLLVIACPCALVISTPVAVVVSLGVAARNGILVKGGAYLEQARLIKNMAFDKTGTLTKGIPQLNKLVFLNNDTPNDYILSLAYGMANKSDHPISLAIKNGIENKSNLNGLNTATDILKNIDIKQFSAFAGGGVLGRFNDDEIYMGSYSWVSKKLSSSVTYHQISPQTELEIASLQAKGHSITIIASNALGMLALFAVSDSIRENAKNVINQLRHLGINSAMLSGDSMAAAKYIGHKCGIDKVHGSLLPLEKLNHIKSLANQGVTAMVGDGINDAPALAQADIGFAMGAMGSDSAIETADVALMDSNLEKIPFFVKLSKRTHNILVQNISIALGIKLLFLAFTVVGMATMWMAVFADVGASLIVLGNSMRVLKNKN